MLSWKQFINRLIFSLLIAGIGLTAIALTDNYYRAEIRLANSEALLNAVEDARHELDQDIAKHIIVAENLQAFMLASETLPDYETFDRFAARLLENYPQVITVQYVDPERIIRHIYPLAGNESALNLDLTTRPAAPFVEKAIRERRLTVNNPTITVQGLVSVIPRVPLYRGDELLGLVQVMMEIDQVLEDAAGNLDERFQFQLRDATGALFWGPDSLGGETESATIPVGDNFWILTVGWRFAPPMPDSFVLMLIWVGGGVLLLSLLFTINQTWNRTEWLRRTVAERTEKLEAEIAQRLIAEEKLGDINLKLEQILRASPLPILGTDQNGYITSWNSAAERLFGWAENEAMGRLSPIVPPEEMQDYLEMIGRAMQGETSSNLVRYRQKKDGLRLICNVSAAPQINEHGDTIGVTIILEDITERKHSEEALRESEEQYRALFNRIPVALYRTSPRGKLLDANPALVELLGYPDYETLSKVNVSEIYVEPEERVQANIVLAQEGVVRDVESSLLRFDGSVIRVRDTSRIVKDADGNVIYYEGSLEDITERKKYEEELRAFNTELEQRVAKRTEEIIKANTELEHANRAKDEFLANMSHELRTPLNSILGLSESLLEEKRGPLNEHQQMSLQIIESSGRHLLELINDVLDLSKIDAGMLDYYPQTVNVDTLCRSSLVFIKEQAIRKFIDIVYEENKSVSNIYADPRRLKQILINLLTNAVKFTPERGRVTLQVHADADNDVVQFTINDNGIGITPEDLKRLFQPFVQVDSSLNRRFEGTGLGLALVQKLTDLHGGSVHVESEAGVGSRFTIHIPWGRQRAEQQEITGSGGEPLKSSKSHLPSEKPVEPGIILLAEDNMANILTIGEYLESHGYKIVTAHDGWETIVKAEEVNPDIILMDIQMPVMDGLEATRHLRKNPRFATTPIIALTALAMPGDRERCLETGANEYMSKPVSLKGLTKTIKDLLQRRDE